MEFLFSIDLINKNKRFTWLWVFCIWIVNWWCQTNIINFLISSNSFVKMGCSNSSFIIIIKCLPSFWESVRKLINIIKPFGMWITSILNRSKFLSSFLSFEIDKPSLFIFNDNISERRLSFINYFIYFQFSLTSKPLKELFFQLNGSFCYNNPLLMMISILELILCGT